MKAQPWTLDRWAEAVFDMEFPGQLHQMQRDGLSPSRKKTESPNAFSCVDQNWLMPRVTSIGEGLKRVRFNRYPPKPKHFEVCPSSILGCFLVRVMLLKKMHPNEVIGLCYHPLEQCLLLGECF